jgi:CRISPR type III-associated protein (TIGR04423 family)
MKPIYNSLDKVPDLAYDGYVWMSDASKPIVLNGDKFDFSNIQINPFVIEALLFNKEKNISIHIQHTGHYQISEYDLTALENEGAVLEEKAYLPHRLTEVSKVNFQQVWMEEPDNLCENMPVLKLKAIVFCGFNKTKNHE